MINNNIEKAINKQINAELYSAYLYLSMSANFKRLNLKGMANWIRVQGLEEMTHADKFYNHIAERGGKVILEAIEKPKTEWKTPLEAFEDVYNHEQKVTAMINSIVDLSEKEKDYASKGLLQWFVDEQIEEEASADEIVQKLKLMKDAPGGLYMLDKELGTRVFTPPAVKEEG
jgi:ferritin